MDAGGKALGDMWGQHKCLPQGEPDFRHLLYCARLPGALLLAHVIIHTVEDGDDIFTST